MKSPSRLMGDRKNEPKEREEKEEERALHFGERNQFLYDSLYARLPEPSA